MRTDALLLPLILAHPFGEERSYQPLLLHLKGIALILLHVLFEELVEFSPFAFLRKVGLEIENLTFLYLLVFEVLSIFQKTISILFTNNIL